MPIAPLKNPLYFELRGAAPDGPAGSPSGTSTGPSQGRTIVLLNGMSQSTANWSSQARELEAAGWRVLMYDARGQGRSPLGAEPVTLDGHVDDLRALLDHVALDHVATETGAGGPVVLCGFSHGARIALRTAVLAPDRVAALVLTSMGARSDALRRAKLRGWRHVLDSAGLEAMARVTITDILGNAWLEQNERMFDAIVRATVQRNDRQALLALLDAMLAFAPALTDAPLVRCPTLLITATDDLLVSTQAAAELAVAIPGCEARVVTDCGHTIPIERPDLWRQLVLDFLARALA